MTKTYTTLYTKHNAARNNHISVLLVVGGDSKRVIVETPHAIPDTGPYIYSQYEQAAGEVYDYIDAMIAGSMMRPSCLHGPALVVGLGSGSLTKQAYELHDSVTSVEYNPEVIEVAHQYFGVTGVVFNQDGYTHMKELAGTLMPCYGTIYVDVFGLNDNKELLIPPQFLMERFYDYVYDVLYPENSMLVVNLGDSAIGGPQHGEVRRIIQYLGTIFDRVYVSKVNDTATHNGNLIVACLKHPSADKDFYLPSDYQESQTANYLPAVGYNKKIRFQRFHAFGKVSEQAVPQYAGEFPWVVNHYNYFNLSLWDSFKGSSRASLTHDGHHMKALWEKAHNAGEYASAYMTGVYHEDELVAILPIYVDKSCATPDGQVVYTHCMLGEDIIINYEPLIDVAYFPAVTKFLPSYISQDISFHYSDRVFRSIKTAGHDPYALFPKMGVCLFEYEVTRIRPLDQLYDLMPRDTRKEAQRLMRNVERDFIIEYSHDYPKNVEHPQHDDWTVLRNNYMAYRKEIDDELEGTEGYVSSVEGTAEHLSACARAHQLGLLRTVRYRKRDTGELVAVNFSIVHPDSEVVADVVCVRDCSPEYKKYGFGITMILHNFVAMNDEPGIEWYDLGNMGTENNYKYKQMFFTDLVFRFGVAKASESMLIEASMKDSGYIFPMSYLNPQTMQHEAVNSREDAERLFLSLDLDTIRDVQEYYESLTIHSPMRQHIKERLDAIIYAKEHKHVRTESQPQASSSIDGAAVSPA